jgi:hypothetical protein
MKEKTIVVSLFNCKFVKSSSSFLCTYKRLLKEEFTSISCGKGGKRKARKSERRERKRARKKTSSIDNGTTTQKQSVARVVI